MLILAAALAASPAPGLSRCPPRALALRFDGGSGDFNGMSHSGAYAVITNRGRTTCTVPALPLVRLHDRAARPLPITRRAPPGMHPGPVMLPVTLAPGTSARTGLRWVSGPVFEHSRCWDVRRATVTIAARTLAAPLSAHVCGEGASATFDQPGMEAPR